LSLKQSHRNNTTPRAPTTPATLPANPPVGLAAAAIPFEVEDATPPVVAEIWAAENSEARSDPDAIAEFRAPLLIASVVFTTAAPLMVTAPLAICAFNAPT